MPSICILYATREGQTRRIAEHVAHVHCFESALTQLEEMAGTVASGTISRAATPVPG